MPIKPENRKLYPPDWDDISIRIRQRAEYECEQCGAEHGRPTPTGTIVVLTVHHIDRDPTHNGDENLLALCQRCHLEADQDRHTANRTGRYQPPLPGLADALGHSALRQQPDNILSPDETQ